MYLTIGLLCFCYIVFVSLLVLSLCKAAYRGDQKDDEAYYAMTGQRTPEQMPDKSVLSSFPYSD